MKLVKTFPRNSMTSEIFGNIDLRAGFTRLHRLKLSLASQDPREPATNRGRQRIEYTAGI